MRLQLSEKYDEAFDLLKHCEAINPGAGEVYYLLAAYYGEMQQDSMAILCYKRAADCSPENHDYLERLAQVYINEGKLSEATTVYEKLYEGNKSRSDVLSMLLRLYNNEKNYDKMLLTVNRLEDTDGPSEQLSFTRVSIYEQQNKKKEALNELKTLAQRHPNDLNYRVMIGNWLLRNEHKDQALAEYEKVLSEEPDNVMAQTSLIDYYLADGQDSVARQMQERMLFSAKTPSDTKIIILRQVIEENETNGGDSTKVLRLFDRIMEANPSDSSIPSIWAAYMSLKQMPDDSVNVALNRILSITPDDAAARIELLQNLWRNKDFDQVIDLSLQGQEYNPEEMAFYYFEGLSHYQKEQKDKALDAFRRGVGQINEQSNKNIVSDFYAIMGDILHDKGQSQEAYAAYDSCLQWKDDNYGCLNNYAYYLSEEGKQLQKAEQMSFRTIKAEPNNSTYLDTYAWILFMQERYAEAQIYIDQAIQNDTTASVVLLEHGGDIHAMNNDLLQALDLWQKALDGGSDSKVLIRKIKIRKYIKE
ncbi:MAG: hypothetical protein J5506_07785 [Prevotella sp.]|nr:hypothetical protein [Prevotella sp.]